jgi:hypothetical protein
MVINKKYDATHVSTWEILGKSTDQKPTVANGAEEPVPDMSIFVELDTGDGYYYTKSTDTWAAIGG